MSEVPSKVREVIRRNVPLRRYLENLAKGKAATPRSWLYEDMPSSDVFDAWLRKLESLAHGSAPEQVVYEEELKQLDKCGPQGKVPPISTLRDLVYEGVGETTGAQFESTLWREAKSDVLRYFKSRGIENLEMWDIERVVNSMRGRSVLTSNSGYPYFGRRNSEPALKEAITSAETGEWKKNPAIILFRNYRGKTRKVVMFPMAANIVEGCYNLPLFTALSALEVEVFSPWQGFEACKYACTQHYGKDRYLVATDFSHTDSHFTWRHSEQVLEILEPCFRPQYRAGLRQSILAMHNIPILVGPTQWVNDVHGLASGSMWTNFLETIFDLVFAKYCQKLFLKHGIRVGCVYAIGDDILWETLATSVREEATYLFAEAADSVGMEINTSKETNQFDTVKSLQRVYYRGYFQRKSKVLRAVYPTIRALNSSIFPERYHNPRDWSYEMFCARQFMILENCKDHPLFEDFVRFICDGNVHLRRFAQLSGDSLAEITAKAKTLPGLNSTYNQERANTSLANFDSVRLARKL